MMCTVIKRLKLICTLFLWNTRFGVFKKSQYLLTFIHIYSWNFKIRGGSSMLLKHFLQILTFKFLKHVCLVGWMWWEALLHSLFFPIPFSFSPSIHRLTLNVKGKVLKHQKTSVPHKTNSWEGLSAPPKGAAPAFFLFFIKGFGGCRAPLHPSQKQWWR